MSTELLVLVVEDEYLDRLCAVEIIEEAGLTPIEAGSPMEAAELLKARSDIVMVIVGAEIIQSPRGRELVLLLEEMSELVVLISCTHRLAANHHLPNHGVLRTPFHRPSVVSELRRLSRELTAPPDTKWL